MLSKVLLLKQLYLKRLCGDTYCDNIIFKKPFRDGISITNINQTIKSCNLCELAKSADNKIIGINDKNSTIIFITLKPIMQYTSSFEMISNIAKRVFEVESYSLLSLIKCNTHLKIQYKHIEVCMEYIKLQIQELDSKIIILFGDEVANALLGMQEKLDNLRGRILSHILDKQRDFIVTYSISDLLKNQSFKKAAMEDFKIAKTYLKGVR